MTRISTVVNGNRVGADVASERLLIDFLRYDLGLTGTKEGCSIGVCGVCSVLLDGQLVSACLALAVFADGAAVTTIEGLDDAGVCRAAHVALVGAAPRPVRAAAAEDALVGQRPAVGAIAEVAELAKVVADPLDDWRGSARYKRRMVGVFTRRALGEAFERARG